jgi:diaminopimelate epimerase
MKTIPFVKMSGAGNDFVVIDNRAEVVPEPASIFAARVCARQAAVGADGLLLLEASSRKDFRMRYFNTDGSEAEMCGNGGRCIAQFAALIGAAERSMQFENLAGDFHASIVEEGRVRLEMTSPHSLRLDVAIEIQGRMLRAHAINTGVPHVVVVWDDDIDKAPVRDQGSIIRHHRAFAPAGTNVNFVNVIDSQTIAVRTYERGVEDETLACGTGAVASAILMARIGRARPPVAVRVRSGTTLAVGFELKGDEAKSVTLEGEAVVLFDGELNLHAFGYQSSSPRQAARPEKQESTL